jgi:L,D-transpeptidase catalytic domain
LALVSGVALTMLASLTSSADAYYPRRLRYYGPSAWYYGSGNGSGRNVHYARQGSREKSEPKKDVGWELHDGPLQVVVTIGTQKVSLYSNGVRVAQGAVSTGVPGHPTPMGVFSVIEKDRYHHSNIYSGAPMPYMQRITWSGVALHEGVVPGHPASHGCIRLTHDFAAKLWPITKLGVRVLVVRNEVSPVEFAHPKLFVPASKPGGPSIALNGTTDGRRVAQSVRVAQAATTSTEARPEAEAPAAQETDRAKPIAPSAPIAAEDGKGVPAAIEAAQPSKPAELAAPTAPTELRKAVAMPEQSAGTTVEPTVTGTLADDDFAKPAPGFDPGKPVPPRIKLIDQPVKHSGQVAVFISRKEKKIFIRQGMVPVLDMPIAIEEPDQPLGTHVFTALGTTEDGGMHWNLMTIPTDGTPAPERRDSRRRLREPAPPPPSVHLKAPSSATEALDRVQMPKQALDRISELMGAGSSLVISDEGLGRETGRGTEFIVLTR